MTTATIHSIGVWENEGGSRDKRESAWGLNRALTGTPGQIEWAEQIRLRVGAEFDRVAAAFQAVAANQSRAGQARTQAVMAILEEKREEVLARSQAGYFIRDWQEMRDQVRQSIAKDPRYQAMQAARAASPPEPAKPIWRQTSA